MTHNIENEQFSVQIRPHGAELCSVKSKDTAYEYIWQANPAIWARHAPVLFPIVGKLNNDQYRLGDKTYTMPQHGFARDKEFTCTQSENQRLSFQLSADQETKEKYPFDFMLEIQYELSGHQLAVTYLVKNRDEQPMPFSIGAHPAFCCPAQIDHHWEEYQLLFEKNETLERHFIKNGLRNGKTKRLLKDEHMLPLHRHLFKNDAIVFCGTASDCVSILAQTTGRKIVSVYFRDFPYLGIWQKLGAGFYCIEPWLGLADKQGFDGDFTEKEGIQILEPGKEFSVGYTMEFH